MGKMIAGMSKERHEREEEAKDFTEG